eukprot:1996187-Amphidinium_carterae.1
MASASSLLQQGKQFFDSPCSLGFQVTSVPHQCNQLLEPSGTSTSWKHSTKQNNNMLKRNLQN